MTKTAAEVSQATKAEGFAGAATRPQHTRAEKYPVLYLLHGFGNNHATWTGYTNLELYAEERNIAVVMISALGFVLINLLVDLLMPLFDPRLKTVIGGAV